MVHQHLIHLPYTLTHKLNFTDTFLLFLLNFRLYLSGTRGYPNPCSTLIGIKGLSQGFNSDITQPAIRIWTSDPLGVKPQSLTPPRFSPRMALDSQILSGKSTGQPWRWAWGGRPHGSAGPEPPPPPGLPPLTLWRPGPVSGPTLWWSKTALGRRSEGRRFLLWCSSESVWIPA